MFLAYSDQVPEEEEFEIVGGANIEPAPEPSPQPKTHERVKTPADAIILDGADGAGESDTATAAVKRPAEAELVAEVETEKGGEGGQGAAKRARVVADDFIMLE